MKTGTLDQTTLFSSIDETVAQLLNLMSSLDESNVNKVPYANSWTAAMLFDHVTKSTNGIDKALQMPSKPAERDIHARIPELEKIFLDFSTKLQSPDFIEPDEKNYQKQDTMDKLAQSFEQLKKNANNESLSELVQGLPLGEITKLELLHFILYHTQRHLHQMKKICDALNK